MCGGRVLTLNVVTEGCWESHFFFFLLGLCRVLDCVQVTETGR